MTKMDRLRQLWLELQILLSKKRWTRVHLYLEENGEYWQGWAWKIEKVTLFEKRYYLTNGAVVLVNDRTINGYDLVLEIEKEAFRQ